MPWPSIARSRPGVFRHPGLSSRMVCRSPRCQIPAAADFNSRGTPTPPRRRASQNTGIAEKDLIQSLVSSSRGPNAVFPLLRDSFHFRGCQCNRWRVVSDIPGLIEQSDDPFKQQSSLDVVGILRKPIVEMNRPFPSVMKACEIFNGVINDVRETIGR